MPYEHFAHAERRQARNVLTSDSSSTYACLDGCIILADLISHSSKRWEIENDERAAVSPPERLTLANTAAFAMPKDSSSWTSDSETQYQSQRLLSHNRLKVSKWQKYVVSFMAVEAEGVDSCGGHC